MAKNSGKLTYNWLAKDAPSHRTNAGADNWHVVGGAPTSQTTSKNGGGQEKNTGKTRQR